MARVTREPLKVSDIEDAKPEAKLYRLRDATVPGLLLRVTPAGRKAWAVTWGRGQERVIGTYPVMTLRAARDAARRELGEAAEHGAPVAVVEARKPAAEKPITVGEFIGEHFSPWALSHQKAGQATINALQACFGDWYGRELRSLSAFDVERFKSRRLKSGRKPATVNRDLDRIRSLYSRAVEWGFLTDHPLRSVKRAKGADDSRVRYLTAAEEQRLRKALVKRETTRRASRDRHNAWHAERGTVGHAQWPKTGFTDHLMPLVLVAMNTGLRRGELFGLSWADVNLPGKLLTVTAGNAKSRKARHIPLNAEAADVLRRWKRQGPKSDLVFPGAGGGRMTNINKSWAGLTTEAELPAFRFHDLRHHFASRLVMAGVDLNTVRELLGHADIAMTLRYAHLAPDKLADAVAKLGATA